MMSLKFEQNRKLFIAGFKEDTTEEQLKCYFESYGRIVDCRIIRDFESHSRGFGFLLFDDASVVDIIMAKKKGGHSFLLDGCDIEIRRALPKPKHGSTYAAKGELFDKRLYVKGLPKYSGTEEEIRRYFERFGPVDEILLLKDDQTKWSKGFAFVTFAEENSASKCLQERSHLICNKMCTVKRARPFKRGSRSCKVGRSFSPDGGIGCNIKRLGMADVCTLVQQAFAMGQASCQLPAVHPSTSVKLTDVKSPVLIDCLIPPGTAAAPLASLNLAQFLQGRLIDINSLGTSSKEVRKNTVSSTAAYYDPNYCSENDGYFHHGLIQHPSWMDTSSSIHSRRALQPY